MIYSNTDIILCFSGIGRSFYYKTGINSSFAMDVDVESKDKAKFIDGIIEEPLGGAHYEPQVAYDHLKASILQNIKAFSKFTGKELETQRQDKFIAMGQFKG